jgi:hypothetical protein
MKVVSLRVSSLSNNIGGKTPASVDFDNRRNNVQLLIKDGRKSR